MTDTKVKDIHAAKLGLKGGIETFKRHGVKHYKMMREKRRENEEKRKLASEPPSTP